MAPKRGGRKASGSSHRSTLSLQKTEVTINVYDLLPPGKLSSVLWTVGASLLHSGVVINNKEYAYGGHDRPNTTGVYWTRPKMEPPGGSFKCSILHGFTLSPSDEIDIIIKEVSDVFLGTSYNLLNRNCNHFTSYLVERLTGRPAPGWLNRAAGIGVALPCIVPKEWVSPPDFETVEGELVDDEDGDGDATWAHERSRMLGDTGLARREHSLEECSMDGGPNGAWDSEEERRRGGNGKGKGAVKDTAGRVLPAAERVPIDGR